MDYKGIRNKIDEGKKIIEKYKDETPQPVLEICYSMFKLKRNKRKYSFGSGEPFKPQL